MAKKDKKKVETNLIENKSDIEVKDEVIPKEEVVQDNVEEIKESKKSRFLDEFKAFLILAIIIVLVVFSGWYWYTYIYDGEENKVSYKEEKVVDQYKSHKYTVADSRKLDVLNEKYVVEYDDEKIYKIMDLKTNVLFEGEEYFDYYTIGIDDSFYIVTDEEGDNENLISIYKLEDNSFKKMKELNEPALYYVPIYYKNGNEKYLLAFSGMRYSYDEEGNETYTTFVYTLQDKEYELSNYQIVGDEVVKDSKSPIISYDDENIIISSIETYKESEYGLMELSNGNIVIKPQYERLYTDYNSDNYIAIKDSKAGVITNKLKKIVDFQYDFIAIYDNYYVVAKNNKMAIMDNQYKLVTEFLFDYQSMSEESSYVYNDVNSIDSHMVNDKYILTINNLQLENNIQYAKSETYIINTDGTYNVINAHKFYVDDFNDLIYAYDNTTKMITFYNLALEELYKIDLSSYDYDNIPSISLVHSNTIRIKLDSSIYFDYEDGKELEDIKDFSVLINGITISYDKKNKQVKYSSSNKELALVDIVNLEEGCEYFVELDNDSFYYNTDSQYLYIEKTHD